MIIKNVVVPAKKLAAPSRGRNTDLLNKIRARHLDEVLDNMTARIACEVTKRYLLPMFDADARVQIDKERAVNFGMGKSLNSGATKLSDKIFEELD
jgi:hypothetical protein